MFRQKLGGIVFIFLYLHQILCHPLSEIENSVYIKARLGNYKQRFDILAKNINPKFAADLTLLMQTFDAALEDENMEKSASLLESFMDQIDLDFANYLQYELDAQHMNEDINIEMWYLEQLLGLIDNADLAADIRHLLSYYEIAGSTKEIDKKFNVYSSIENQISPRLLTYFDTEPIPSALLKIHLRLFREFLSYLIKTCNLYEFEEDITRLLVNLDEALINEGKAYEEKMELLDRFDDVSSKFGQFLDANIHEFEIYKFG